MSGWVGIPHAAVSAVRGPLARGAVLDLYSRAHQVGYTPMAFTDRELSVDWGMTRHEVWRVLEALEAAELLTIDRAPSGARRPSRLTVHPAVSSGSGQSSGQTPGQNERPTRPAKSEARPDSRPVSRPPRAEEIARALRGDQTRSDPPSLRSGEEEQRAHAREAAPPLEDEPAEGSSVDAIPPERIEEDIAVLVALQERDEPQHGLCSQRDRAAVRHALGQGVTRDQLCALWAWSAVSQDPLIAGCHKGGWRRWSSMLRRSSGGARIEAALAWVAAGRPASTATGPPVAQSSPRRFSAAELLADDLTTNTEAQCQPRTPSFDSLAGSKGRA